jgi:SAM-dependent methyltransferase
MNRKILIFIKRQLRKKKYKCVESQFILSEDDQIKKRGELIAQETFIGGPISKFSKIGRLYLITLLKMGLTPDSKVLDVGCGALRGGFWLIHFLNPNCYYGIEPNETMLEVGKKLLLTEETISYKNPRFDTNSDFIFSRFNQKFDYIIARSIWSHASKQQILKMLDEFVNTSTPNGVFLTSYLRPYFSNQDYKGKEWKGRSHDSNISGIIYHSFSWINNECKKRQLNVKELRFDYIDQIWLCISRLTNIHLK